MILRDKGVTLMLGDCLELMKTIPDGSVDLILTDPPYGTVKNIGDSKSIKHGMKNKTGWDETLDFNLMWSEINRILRKNGKCILFSQEPFTSDLIKSTIPNIPFLYRCVWEKDHFANALNAKKSPLNFFEDILIFGKNNPILDFDKKNPLRDIMRKYVDKYGMAFLIDLFLKEGRYSSINSAKTHAKYKFGFGNGDRVDLMNESLYLFLSNFIEFDEDYEELKLINSQFQRNTALMLNNKYPSIFNLHNGDKFKSNIFKYKKDYDGFHPTQKPVLLLEDLIQTYSNEGNTILDFTMGSGSTGVACVNTGRNFIGIELDPTYFGISVSRIAEGAFG